MILIYHILEQLVKLWSKLINDISRVVEYFNLDMIILVH